MIVHPTPEHPLPVSLPSDRRRWTFSHMLHESEQVARALLARFQPGERVAVWAPNTAEWILLEFGAALAGIVLVTVNPAFRLAGTGAPASA